MQSVEQIEEGTDESTRISRITAVRAKATPAVDARYFPRAPLEADVTARIGDRTDRWRLVNISEGGASLRAGVSLERGTHVTLDFSLPTGRRVHAEATIVWSEHRPTGDVGIQFGDLDERTLASIRAFVETCEPMAWDAASPLPREIAVRFVPLIRRQAFSLARRTGGRFPAEDLVGVGFLALVEAYGRFDWTHGLAFEGYALVRIRGAMLDELRSVDPLTRSARRFRRSMEGAVARLSSQLGRAPSEEEIAADLEMSLSEYRACLETVTCESVDFDSMPRESDSAARYRLAADEPSPEDRAATSESARRVERAVRALPPRLREVLDMYFGENRTMRDIGSVLGVTEARISQLVTQAIGKVREELGGEVTTVRLAKR